MWKHQKCDPSNVCNIFCHSPTPMCVTYYVTPQLPAKQVSMSQLGHRDLTLQLDSKEWRPHFGVLSRLQNCLNTVLEFLALNYSHQDKGLKCEVIVRWTKEPAQRTVLYSFSYNSYYSYNIWRANQPDEEELTTTTVHSSTWSYTVF